MLNQVYYSWTILLRTSTVLNLLWDQEFLGISLLTLQRPPGVLSAPEQTPWEGGTLEPAATARDLREGLISGEAKLFHSTD